MTWSTRDPRTYSARYPSAHREAVASTPLPTIFDIYPSLSQAEASSFSLRKYRFLLRSNPGLDFSLDRLMSDFVFRSKIEVNSFGDATLLLYARPAHSTALLSLNPEIAGLIPPDCQ